MSLFRQLTDSFQGAEPGVWLTYLLDILVVAYLFYRLILMTRGTRAWQILWGLGIFFAAVSLSEQLHLDTLSWLLQKFVYMGPVAIVILFYPELRHALEEMGRLRWWGSHFSFLPGEDVTRMVDEVVKASVDLAHRKVGALIVVERETRLDDIVATGKRMDADLSAELLSTIFHPGSPLHDQAVVISGRRIVAASCVLPLSDDPSVGLGVHTRHRAALGVSEVSDGVVIVVSEETGAISVCSNGRLIRGLNKETLRDWLLSALQPPKPVPSRRNFNWIRSRIRAEDTP
ncbi:MAG: diadenylate cyclase CdaA [Armatimonadetes bacterium]|nr:diadenylate cyclase CdaA [Armatimonadota bacterium]